MTEAFLARQLGGRYEPVGGDFKGASIHVPTGAEGVPGLDSTLPDERRRMPTPPDQQSESTDPDPSHLAE